MSVSEGLGVNQGKMNLSFIVMVALQNLHELAGFQGQGAGGLGLVQKGSCNYWKQYQYQ